MQMIKKYKVIISALIVVNLLMYSFAPLYISATEITETKEQEVIESDSANKEDQIEEENDEDNNHEDVQDDKSDEVNGNEDNSQDISLEDQAQEDSALDELTQEESEQEQIREEQTEDEIREEQEEWANTFSGNVIQIDGNYTDWGHIPHMDISWYSPDPNQVHQGALYLEDDILYVHYKMNDAYKAQMVLSFMELSINNDTRVSLMMQKKNPDGTIDWSGDIYNLPVGTTTGLGIFYNEHPKYFMGDAAFTVYDSNHLVGDEAEFAIDLNVVSRITNIPVESMRQLTLFNPNIGKDAISVGGSSTGAVAGVLVVTSIAIAGVYINKKRKKVVG